MMPDSYAETKKFPSKYGNAEQTASTNDWNIPLRLRLFKEFLEVPTPPFGRTLQQRRHRECSSIQQRSRGRVLGKGRGEESHDFFSFSYADVRSFSRLHHRSGEPYSDADIESTPHNGNA
jgi:hypothetical protein